MTSIKFEPIRDKCADIVEFLLNTPDIPDDPELQFKIRLCCEEAVQNVVDYAYKDGSGYLEAGTDSRDGILFIYLKDAGVPFDPLAKDDPDINASLEDRQIGGLGIFLCKQMMDKVLYCFEDGCNKLTMCIKINQ